MSVSLVVPMLLLSPLRTRSTNSPNEESAVQHAFLLRVSLMKHC